MVKEYYKKILDYFDNLSLAYKTYFLIFIISGGMICIVILSQISIFTIKNDFDILFDKRTKSLIKLENIKDTFKVNIQDTLKDLEKKNITYSQAKDVLLLAEQLIDKNWISYKNELSLKNDELISTFIKRFIINSDKNDNNDILKDSIIKNIDSKMLNIKAELDWIDNDVNNFE